MTLYLVGVNHEATRYQQAYGLTEGNVAFISVAVSVIKKHQIDYLAEEELPERLIAKCATSLLDALHRSSKIRHAFVDPNIRERKSIRYRDKNAICELEEFRNSVSYPLEINGDDCTGEVEKIAHAHEIAHQFPIRESFWITELAKLKAESILFVCGDIHLETFPSLLAQQGIAYEIVGSGVGVQDFNSLEYQGLKYAQQHRMLNQTDCFCRKDSCHL